MNKFRKHIFKLLKTTGFIQILKTQARKFGFTFVDSNNVSRVYDFVNLVKSLGIKLDVIYDIGANDGQWTREIQKKCPFKLTLILFEPNAFHNESLKSTNSRYFNEILSDCVETVNFYSLNGTGDSIFKEISERYDSVTPLSLKSKMLDDFVREEGLPLPDLIKIDTQGSELNILRGSRGILSSVKFVVLECPILEYNLGAPDINQIIVFMENEGFKPYSIAEFHKNKKILFQLDIIFVAETLIDLLP
jgi:FkbM family methyltransferase